MPFGATHLPSDNDTRTHRQIGPQYILSISLQTHAFETLLGGSAASQMLIATRVIAARTGCSGERRIQSPPVVILLHIATHSKQIVWLARPM